MNVLGQYWHPILWSKEVTDKPVSVKLLDQPLVIWRSNDKVSAFYDLCIHRGTPLSLGWVDCDKLVCAYHGWNYAADGSCTRIPSLPPDREIPAKARARTFRVQERYGLIWVCLDEPRQDIPAFPAEFGDPERSQAPEITITETAGGFQYEIDTPVNRFRPNSAAKQLYSVILPFMVTIQRRQPGSIERHTNIYLCTPVSNHETKFYRLAGRNYRDVKSDEQLNAQHRRIFEQDKRIVESQRPEELPLDLAEELHLRGPDTPAVEYRRRLRQLGIDWH